MEDRKKQNEMSDLEGSQVHKSGRQCNEQKAGIIRENPLKGQPVAVFLLGVDEGK